MNRQQINRICAILPLILSLAACIWVLGNVAGGVRANGNEGLGFHVFWVLIVAQMPIALAYLATADWNRQSKVATNIVLQVVALVLAFAPVAYFRL